MQHTITYAFSQLQVVAFDKTYNYDKVRNQTFFIPIFFNCVHLRTYIMELEMALVETLAKTFSSNLRERWYQEMELIQLT